MSDLFGVRLSGPLEPFGEGFVAELSRLGYTPLSMAEQLRLAAHVSRWLSDRGLQAGDLGPAAVQEFLAVRRAAGYRARLSSTTLDLLLQHLRRAGVLAPAAPMAVTPVEAVLERFRDYLLSERGMVVQAAGGYAGSVRPFVRDVIGQSGVDPAKVTAGQITAFMIARSGRLAPKTLQHTASALRALLRFWHLDGVVDGSLSQAVPRVAYRWPGLPRAAAPAEVRALLDSCSEVPGFNGGGGRRDYAILLLLSRLGLRAGEVAALQLDDLDWRAGQITVPGKGQRRDLLPLPVEVGEGIAAYLRHDRPAEALDRRVFIRVKAPHRGLTGAGVTQVVASASHRAGLDTIYAHRLRHSAATHMLASGSSLAEVGQVLRHRRALTTAIYARVDVEALRALARPWPAVAS